DQPATVHPTYELALMHAAIYDAVVSIDRSAAPYLVQVHAPRSASTASAADAAAHDMLVALYPALTASIDDEYAQQLAALQPSRAKEKGSRWARRPPARWSLRAAATGGTRHRCRSRQARRRATTS